MVKKILIADADPSRRTLLRATLQDPRYEIIEASGGVQALALRERHRPDLVILDEAMPGVSGMEVCRAIKHDRGAGNTPVILLTEQDGIRRSVRPAPTFSCPSHTARCACWKPSRNCSRRRRAKPMHDDIAGLTRAELEREVRYWRTQSLLLARISAGCGPICPARRRRWSLLRAQLLSYAEDLNREYQLVRERTVELERLLVATVGALANSIEARDPYTRGHTDRVARITLAFCERLGWERERLSIARMGVLLHDIGKIGVPDAILRKPGRLTAEEYELMKQHTTIGRADPAGHRRPGAGDPVRAAPPRALGRQGLPARAGRRGDPHRGAHPRRSSTPSTP